MQEQNWCRTCLQTICNTSQSYTLDYTDAIEMTSIRSKLKCLLPDLDVNIVVNAIICNDCFLTINTAYTFKTNCSAVEQHISNYRRSTASKSVEVKDVVHFIESNLATITTEVTVIQEDECLDGLLENIPQLQEANDRSGNDIKQNAVEYKCDLCEYCSNLKSKLRLHFDKVHRSENRENMTVNLFSCTLCNLKFKRVRNLNRHSLTHTSDKPFKCSSCDFKSNRKDALNNHLANKHSTDKIFKCAQCYLAFSNNYALTRHNRTHSNDKPFQCTECDFKCKFESYLKSHMSKHSNYSQLKSFKCIICNFGSCTKKGLSRHLTTHTGEKPYSCTKCDYKSSEESKLKRHQLTHNKSLNCVICDYKCRFKKDLKEHLEQMHFD